MSKGISTEEIVMIDEMKAGPKLDVLIVEKVMNRVPCDNWEYFRAGGLDGLKKNDICKDHDCYPRDGAAGYSINITAAFQVVDFLLEYAYPFELEWIGAKEGWQCFITEPTRARTAPLAICRAALKTVKEKIR